MHIHSGFILETIWSKSFRNQEKIYDDALDTSKEGGGEGMEEGEVVSSGQGAPPP